MNQNVITEEYSELWNQAGLKVYGERSRGEHSETDGYG